MKDAKATSEGLAGIAKKVLTIIIALTPAGIATAIGMNSDFELKQWLWYPAGLTLLALFLFMHWSAFKMHKTQEERIKELEDARAVKLLIERVSYQRDIRLGYICRVTLRNLSSSLLTNVHVRVIGELVPGIFVEGYSPFNEPDLNSASGSREINPHSESDWLFPTPFNDMVGMINGRISVVSSLYGGKKQEQTFVVSASASNSPPVKTQFRLVEGATEAGPAFVKL